MQAHTNEVSTRLGASRVFRNYRPSSYDGQIFRSAGGRDLDLDRAQVRKVPSCGGDGQIWIVGLETTVLWGLRPEITEEWQIQIVSHDNTVALE
jgi:hypothetical protein